MERLHLGRDAPGQDAVDEGRIVHVIAKPVYNLSIEGEVGGGDGPSVPPAPAEEAGLEDVFQWEI